MQVNEYPKAAKNYSITELEMYGLAINIASFAHLLKRVDFDYILDHLALTHNIKSKAELTTTRIKRLLEILSSYSFNLYYIKGKDMILSDFLSDRNMTTATHMKSYLFHLTCKMYYILCERNEGKYFVQTRSQAKSSCITLPEVHGVDKGIDPNIQFESRL